MDKRNLFTRIEDKYVFTVSTVVWHICVALAAIGVVIGVCVFLVGAIPAMKDTPEKGKYPAIVNVTPEEIRARVAPASEQPRPAVRADRKKAIRAEKPAEAPLPDNISKELEAAYATLRTLLPSPKFAWASSGEWYFPYGRFMPQYRRWVVRSLGIPGRINSVCKEANITTDAEKAQFVLACSDVIKAFPLDKRGPVFAAALRVAQTSTTKTLANLTLLRTLGNDLMKDRVDLLVASADLLQANPKDGSTFFEFALSAINSFDPSVKADAISTMMRNYRGQFSGNLDRLKEFTAPFLPMAKSFEPKFQASALDQYYALAIAKNVQREQEIRKVDAQYARALEKAEAEYSAANLKKAALRMAGAYGIGSGIGTIAFVALLLVLLSIQRYLRKLVELQTKVVAPTGNEQ